MRATTFPGARQIDREALRREAQRLEWADADIVEQVCGGGVELRADCELLTVLAFHHPGLARQAAAAAAAVDADASGGVGGGSCPPPPVRALHTAAPGRGAAGA
eukprot:5294272-Pleurochrysis_carterae.AAC.2